MVVDEQNDELTLQAQRQMQDRDDRHDRDVEVCVESGGTQHSPTLRRG
jgi:hypothetical protein